MLRIVFAALLLAFAVMPPAAAQDDPAAILKGYLAAWNAGDAEAAVAFMTDDVVFFDAATAEPINGRAAALELVQGFMAAISEVNWEIRGEPVLTADAIAFEWTFSGVNTGAFGPEMPATNKPISFVGASVIRLAGGKIAYEGDYYDTGSLFAQLGGQ